MDSHITPPGDKSRKRAEDSNWSDPVQQPDARTHEWAGNTPPGWRQSSMPTEPLSAHKRSRFAVTAIAALITINALTIPGVLEDIGLLQKHGLDAYGPDVPLTAGTLLFALLGIFSIPLFIVCAVAFCMWIHRAYRVLEENGVEGLEHSPAKAAGFFFVPILNLYKPYQIMKEIDAKSAPGPRPGMAFGGVEGVPPWVMGAWWMAWIISGAISQISWRLADMESVSNMITSDYLDIASLAIQVVAGIFIIKIIRGIDSRQAMAFGRPGGVKVPAGVGTH